MQEHSSKDDGLAPNLSLSSAATARCPWRRTPSINGAVVGNVAVKGGNPDDHAQLSMWRALKKNNMQWRHMLLGTTDHHLAISDLPVFAYGQPLSTRAQR